MFGATKPPSFLPCSIDVQHRRAVQPAWPTESRQKTLKPVSLRSQFYTALHRPACCWAKYQPAARRIGTASPDSRSASVRSPCCSCLSLPARWAIVRWRITGMWDHLFFSCVLIWLTSSASSGLVRGENRFTRLPSRSIRNFSKFQLTLPFPAGLASLLVKYL